MTLHHLVDNNTNHGRPPTGKPADGNQPTTHSAQLPQPLPDLHRDQDPQHTDLPACYRPLRSLSDHFNSDLL